MHPGGGGHVGERAAVVAEEPAGAVVGDEQVLVAVVVVVGSAAAVAPALRIVDARRGRRLGEGRVAVVPVQHVRADGVYGVDVVQAVPVEVDHQDTAAKGEHLRLVRYVIKRYAGRFGGVGEGRRLVHRLRDARLRSQAGVLPDQRAQEEHAHAAERAQAPRRPGEHRHGAARHHPCQPPEGHGAARRGGEQQSSRRRGAHTQAEQ